MRSILNKKKILILGINGTLGKKLYQDLKKNRNFRTCGISKKNSDFNLNLENFKKLELFLKKNKFEIVVNCAAYTNLIFCEKNFKKILKVNTLLPAKLSLWTSRYNFKYVHISTDHVYLSKKNVANKENSKIGWHNYYSKSKFLAEKNLINKSNLIIVRTNFMDDKRNKKSFLNWLHKLIKNKIEIPLYKDMYTSTIDLRSLTKILIKLILKNSSGVFNIGSSEYISKKQFALKYFKKLKINPLFKNVKTNDKLQSTIKRGRFLGLNIKKIEKILKIKMPNSDKVINNLYHENFRN